MPDSVVAVQVQVQGVAVVTPQHTGYRVWVRVKALKRQQRIQIHLKKKACTGNNSQESQVIQSSGIRSSEF